MNKIYTYALLSYRHSKVIRKSITIGLLLYCRDDKRIEFIYPSQLHRLSNLYNNVALSILRKTLRSFEVRAVKLSESYKDNLDIFLIETIDLLIRKYFLLEDATSLYFQEPVKGYYEDYDKLKAYLRGSIFSNYTTNKQERFDEARIEDYVTRRIINTNVYSKFRKGITLDNGNFEERFPYSWTNGKENILVPIGFDLIDKESIKKKSYQWFGILESFNDLSRRENYRFDLLVSRPSCDSNYYSYDKALSVLSSINLPNEIVEQDKFNDYINYAIKTLLNQSYIDGQP